MAVHKIRQFDGGSAGITLPKEHLRDAGLIDADGSIRDDQYAAIEQLDEGEWRIRTVDELFD